VPGAAKRKTVPGRARNSGDHGFSEGEDPNKVFGRVRVRHHGQPRLARRALWRAFWAVLGGDDVGPNGGYGTRPITRDAALWDR